MVSKLQPTSSICEGGGKNMHSMEDFPSVSSSSEFLIEKLEKVTLANNVCMSILLLKNKNIIL